MVTVSKIVFSQKILGQCVLDQDKSVETIMHNFHIFSFAHSSVIFISFVHMTTMTTPCLYGINIRKITGIYIKAEVFIIRSNFEIVYIPLIVFRKTYGYCSATTIIRG
jgi:hypothetical protein